MSLIQINWFREKIDKRCRAFCYEAFKKGIQKKSKLCAKDPTFILGFAKNFSRKPLTVSLQKVRDFIAVLCNGTAINFLLFKNIFVF